MCLLRFFVNLLKKVNIFSVKVNNVFIYTYWVTNNQYYPYHLEKRGIRYNMVERVWLNDFIKIIKKLIILTFFSILLNHRLLIL